MRLFFFLAVCLVIPSTLFSGEAVPLQFPDMGLAQYLQAYGGWAVASICMIALARLYTKTSNLLEKRNDQFIAVLEKTTTALQATTSTQQDCVMLLRSVSDVLSKTESTLKDFTETAERCRKNRD